MFFRVLAAVVACGASIASARDLHVDPENGDDNLLEGPYRTISVAIRRAEPGDTIHLKPIVYHDSAVFHGIRGEAGKPITLEGNGATLEGSDPLDPTDWTEIEPGLFRADELLPRIDDGMIQRWFFLWDGKMVHMGRTSKGPRAELKEPTDLKPGEWTFVVDSSREHAGAFYLRIAEGKTLVEQNVRVPVRSAGVQFSGMGEKANAHLVIRNLTATHVYNDGFNIHGHCEQVRFENIRAIECGDDGISAHETAEYEVDGFVSVGNSTGICDTGESKTSYRRVFIRDCLGHDLFFLDSGRYSVRDAVVISSASQALVVTGRGRGADACRVELDNVLIRRVGEPVDVRIADDATLAVRRVTFENLGFVARKARGSFVDSDMSGPKLEIAAESEVSVENSSLDFAETVLPDGFEVPEASKPTGAVIDGIEFPEMPK